ncbi:DivIVA domain-containing protein [Agrococcus sp. SL85]|uniref:DivIVA domain-containing protein n=1 Tax=Agrococcus sp. SL85 TaxID=2995141 RepID=UPI00226C9C35|nr:DivIVA domain-containing protein [Agrococcus sp. SL85]WAC66651.1 DivIVA domain-containing protein [Agrococcus sp. SL85]
MSEQAPEFDQAFRGYDRAQVDESLAQLRAALDEARSAKDTSSFDAEARIQHLTEDLDAAVARADQAESRMLRLAQQVQTLDGDGTEPADAASDDGDEGRQTRVRFSEILRVAEDQASTLVTNATSTSQRILDDANAERDRIRKDAKDEAARVLQEAQHEAELVRRRSETEQTAHRARIETELGSLGEKVSQADREAQVLLGEAERAAAALRAQATRETDDLKLDADRIVREAKARRVELDAALTRRQDDAQQEFLRLHNQAVAHAERVTADANEKVASALAHASHVAEQSEAYEQLSRAQAAQVEASAKARAAAMLEEARSRSQAIVDAVTGHTKDVLRDAEDRARSLRWQQQQLTGFMAEVQSLMRIADAADPRTWSGAGDEADGRAAAGAAAAAAAAGAATVAAEDREVVQDAFTAEAPAEDDLASIAIDADEAVEGEALDDDAPATTQEAVEVVWHEETEAYDPAIDR